MKYYDPVTKNEYNSYDEAVADGVVNPTTTPPVQSTGTIANTATTAAAPKLANIPTYGYELQQLMKQYGVSSPVAPRTTDQSLIDQYFKKLQAPMYQTPTGNGLFDQYLNIGLGNIASPFGPMTRFFPGQAVAPAGFRYDPVTNTNVNVTDPGGVASAGQITTGTPNIGGNQCPPGFNFDPVTRSCVPTPETGILTGGKSQSEQQPMPTCPPNTTLDPVNRICIPKGCPAGYEEDASGNCVARSMQTPCPPGFTRDATGVCIPPMVPECPPNTTKNPATGECVPKSCPAGYEMDATGNCVATSMQTPCPPGFERDASGVCLPIIRQAPCPDGKPRDYFGNCAKTEEPKKCPEGFEKDASGNCVAKTEEPKKCPEGFEKDAYGNCVAITITCPTGFEKDAYGNCVEIIKEPTRCPEGFEKDAYGNCVAIIKEPTKCPEGFEKDAYGNCVAKIDKTPCQDGYVRNAAGQCVPDPEQLAFFNKYYQSPQAGEYDIYNAIAKGNLNENLVRDLVSQRGGENIDEWLAKNVDPDKTFSSYAIQNLAAQGRPDDPNVANRGTQSGENRVFDLYQQGAIGLNEIEDAMGKGNVQDWMRANRPDTYQQVYANKPAANVQPANPVFDNAAEQQNMAVYNQAKASGMTAQQVAAQYGIPLNEITDWMGLRGLKLARGGRVSRYSEGGSVGLDGMMKKYQVGGSNRITDFNSMLGQAPAARPAMIGQPPMRDDGLNQMMQQYNVGRTSNTRQDYDQASERLKQAMMSASEASPVAAGPSKAEMYFRLASAFAKPTPTGNFFESLGNASGELAAYRGDVRAAESAAAQQRRDLAIELAKADVTRARDVMEIESESGRPLSSFGEIAVDEGLVMGTPEFTARVQQLSAEDAARKASAGAGEMNSTEARLLDTYMNRLVSARKSAGLINKALSLNADSYSGTSADYLRRVAAGQFNPDDPKLINYNEIQNLLGQNAVASLKATFGGAISDGERVALDNLQGLGAKSLEERERIMLESLNQMLNSIDEAEAAIQRVRSGYYRLRPDQYAGDELGFNTGEAITETAQ